MKEVKLKKVTKEEVEILQQELGMYAEIIKLGFNYISIDEFLNALLISDIALRLWLSFRNKIESDKTKVTVTLKVSEAVVLFKCCYWPRDQRTHYHAMIAEKFKNEIDQQLKSINVVTN